MCSWTIKSLYYEKKAYICFGNNTLYIRSIFCIILHFRKFLFLIKYVTTYMRQ